MIFYFSVESMAGKVPNGSWYQSVKELESEIDKFTHRIELVNFVLVGGLEVVSVPTFSTAEIGQL